jgi:hypothetical protein
VSRTAELPLDLSTALGIIARACVGFVGLYALGLVWWCVGGGA